MIKIHIVFSAVLLLSGCKNQAAQNEGSESQEAYPLLAEGYIEVLDPRLEDVISADAKIEILSQGHEWTEGPLWIESGKLLLYSDIPRNTI